MAFSGMCDRVSCEHRPSCAAPPVKLGFHDCSYLQTRSPRECACLECTNYRTCSCSVAVQAPLYPYCEYCSSTLQQDCSMANRNTTGTNLTPANHSIVGGETVSLRPDAMIDCCFYSLPSHLTHSTPTDWTPTHDVYEDCLLTSSYSDRPCSVPTISTTTPLCHPPHLSPPTCLSPPASPSDVGYQHPNYTVDLSLQQQDSPSTVGCSESYLEQSSLYYSPISASESSSPAEAAPHEKGQSGNSGDGKRLHQHSSTNSKKVEVRTPAYRSYIRNRQARTDRLCFTPEQIQCLESSFECKKYLNLSERQKIALDVGVSSSQVKTWYQNRRTKWKRSHKQVIRSPGQ